MELQSVIVILLQLAFCMTSSSAVFPVPLVLHCVDGTTVDIEIDRLCGKTVVFPSYIRGEKHSLKRRSCKWQTQQDTAASDKQVVLFANNADLRTWRCRTLPDGEDCFKSEFSTGDLFVVPFRDGISGVRLSVEVSMADMRVMQQAVRAALICPDGFCGPDLFCGSQFCYATVTNGIPSPGSTDGPFELIEFANLGELEDFESNLRQDNCHASIIWTLPAKLNVFISASDGKIYSSKQSILQGLEMRLHLPDGWACTGASFCQISLNCSQAGHVNLIPTEQHHSTFVRFRILPVEEHGSKVNTTSFHDDATPNTPPGVDKKPGKGSDSFVLRFVYAFVAFLVAGAVIFASILSVAAFI